MKECIALLDASSIIDLFRKTNKLDTPAFLKLEEMIENGKVILMPTIIYEVIDPSRKKEKKMKIDELVGYVNHNKKTFKEICKHVIARYTNLKWRDFEINLFEMVANCKNDLCKIYKENHVMGFVAVTDRFIENCWQWYKGDIILIATALVLQKHRSLFDLKVVTVSEEVPALQAIHRDPAFKRGLQGHINSQAPRQPLLDSTYVSLTSCLASIDKGWV